METSYLTRKSRQYPTLLSLSNLKPQQKLKVQINLSKSSSSSAMTPSSKSFNNFSFKPKQQSIENIRLPEKKYNTQIPIKPHVVLGSDDKIDRLKFPTTSTEILEKLQNFPEWVKEEITQYETIYFLGKLQKTCKETFDDEKGDYKAIIGDAIAYRYEIVEILGKGTFGLVVKVIDHATKKNLALKIIKNKQRYLEQAYIEVEILKYLNSLETSKNTIVSYEENFMFRSHMFISFELLGMNLYEILKRNSFRGLLLSQIKQYAFQILECMALLYQSHVIHCDLKPENILVSDSCRNFVKVIDFGSSCFSNQRVYSYIQSRFYRAPEIVLGIPYTTAIDMWSLGCILVELYTGLPIFPCEDEKELIACIVEVIGEPPTDVIGQSTRSGLFFNADGELISCANSKGKKRLPRTRSIKSILKGAENEFINVIESCLLWNPKLRITPEAAMKLDWFVESNNSIKSKNKRKYKISMEDITKHTPQLQKFMAHRNKNTK